MIINKIKVHVSIANDHGPWCIYMKKLRYFHLKKKTKSTPQGGSPKKKNQNSKDSVRFHNYLFKLLETVFNF